MAAIQLCLRELEWNWCGSLALSFEKNSFRRKEGGRDRERPCLISSKEKEERENGPNRLHAIRTRN